MIKGHQAAHEDVEEYFGTGLGRHEKLAESPLPERALQALRDPRRNWEVLVHRKRIMSVALIGTVLLFGSLGALKLDFTSSLEWQRLFAFAAFCAFAILVIAGLLAANSWATERFLRRSAFLRLELDSMESAAERLRLQTRLEIAYQAASRLSGERGSLSFALLEALIRLEEDADGRLSGVRAGIANKLKAAGMSEDFLSRFESGTATARSDA